MKRNKMKYGKLFIFFSLSLLTFYILTSDKSNSVFNKVYTNYQNGSLFAKIQQRILERIVSVDDDDEYWVVESVKERESLPEFSMINAESKDNYAIHNDWPERDVYTTWNRSNGDPTLSRYSTLNQINVNNIKDLKPAWVYNSNDGKATVQSNPVIAEKLIFTPTGGHYIVALSAETGKEVWRFKPDGNYPAKRGLVFWPGNNDNEGRIYFSAQDKMYCLNALTGEVINNFGQNGTVHTNGEASIAPVIVDNAIITTTRTAKVQAFNLISGDEIWTLSLTPQSPDRAAGLASKYTGGRTWGGVAVDKKRGLIFLTTANPSPTLVGVDRPGRNKYSVSVIAVDAKRGEVVWDFQEIPHDLWDLDIAAPPILTTISKNNLKIDIVVAITKIGNTLILNRTTGKPIFNIRLRRAPTSTIQGEKTASYQIDMETPLPFSRQVFSREDVTNIGEENTKFVLNSIKNKKFGFFEPPHESQDIVYYGLHGGAMWPGGAVDQDTGILYVAANDVPSLSSILKKTEASEIQELSKLPGREVYLNYCSHCHGKNREGTVAPPLYSIGMRESKDSVHNIIVDGLRGMPSITHIKEHEIDHLLDYLFEKSIDDGITKKGKPKGGHTYMRANYRKLKDHEGYPGSKPPWGTLTAIDLNSGKHLWKIPLGEYKELTQRGIPLTGMENFGAPLVTIGGIVFVSGTKDKKIRAFNSKTGEQLWSFDLPFIGSAAPSTYQIGDRQFLIIPATGGGTMKLYDKSLVSGDAFVAFSLTR
jgi:quinoprotein glucose dehydrogenase